MKNYTFLKRGGGGRDGHPGGKGVPNSKAYISIILVKYVNVMFQISSKIVQ